MKTTNLNAKSGLLEAIRYFSDPMVCLETVAKAKWPKGPNCPRCQSRKLSFIKTRLVWTCLECRKQFSVKVGTIFEDSAIGLDKWLTAMWLVANCKNGISSYEVARDLKVMQRTAWFMLHRIRYAMQNGSVMKLGSGGGEVEVDETFIGGKARFMHRGRRLRALGSNSGLHMGKVAVQGLLERHGQVRTRVVGRVKRNNMVAGVRQHVDPSARVYTDETALYDKLDQDGYTHQVINHAEKYVDGKIHTNGIENFWSLLKRSIKGTYVSVEPFHLFRYLDEQSFRYNERKATDAERFVKVLCSVGGKRLTYAQVRG